MNIFMGHNSIIRYKAKMLNALLRNMAKIALA